MMTSRRAPAPLLTHAVALLERAISYTLGSLSLVTPEALSRPTPCRDWDLRALLRHLDDSLGALHDAADLQRVWVGGAADGPTSAEGPTGADRPAGADGPAGDPVATARNRAGHLLGVWASTDDDPVVSVTGLPLTSSIVTCTGAVEIAVHGWDVARACGHDRPVPAPLAEELLDLARLLVVDADRPARFAAPVEVPPTASPSDRLVAFLGRNPR